MKRINLLFIAAICLATSCAGEIEPEIDKPVNEPAAEKTITPRRTVVKFTKEMISEIENDLKSGEVITKSSKLNDFVEAYGVKSITPVFTHNEKYAERHRRYGLHQWYHVEYDSSKIPATRAAEAIAQLPGVEIAEPERPIVSYSMNDEFFSSQWYLKQSNGIDINVESVWEYTTGNQNVIVSVVDGGIELNHPDLKDNVLPAGAGQSRNFCSNSYRINGDDHGTHVAGIIAASSNNSTGITGIAGGDAKAGVPGVKLMSCQIFDGDQSGNAADAIIWGADNGAVISQNSWGYTFDYNGNGKLDPDEMADAMKSDISPELKAAVDYFIECAGCDGNGNQLPDSPMKGGIVLFAAGNDAITNGAPAGYSRVIAVGSVASDGSRSKFSNYGDWVDICAPGSDIFSTVIGGSYRNMNGTSMACPMVSGVAALVLSYRGGMGFTNEMLWDCLIKGADSKKVTAANVGPFLDAMGAMMYGLDVPAPAPVTSFTAEVKSNQITATWSLTEGENSKPAYGAVIYASTNKASLESLNPLKPSADIKSADVLTYSGTVGETVSGVIGDLEFDKDYHVTVLPYNYGPSYAEVSSIVKVSVGPNNAPVITSDVDTEDIILRSSEAINIKFTIEEPDGHSYTVSWTEGSKGETWMQMSANTYSLRINAADIEEGKYTAILKATDAYGLAKEFPINYSVLENKPPVIIAQIENILLNTEKMSGETLNMSDYFSDPNEDFLSYDIVSSSDRKVHATVTDGVMYLTPREEGKADISVTAKDPSGASVTQSFKVLVRKGEGQADIYPTQVTDYLYIGTGKEEAQVDVKITTAGGQTFRSVNVIASAFNPAQIDLSDAAPGNYVVKASYGGKEYKQNIVKL